MKKEKMVTVWAAVTCALTCGAVSLPPLFGDHAVLHRGAATAVWGEAAPGERVTVSLGGASAEAIADKEGWWTARLDLRKCGEGPFELRAKDAKGEVVSKDVLVGEVWLSSGQSNMEMPFYVKLFGTVFGSEELWKKAAGRPIRVFHKDRSWHTSRSMRHQSGSWILPEPQALSNCSAVAFAFAERLQRTIGGPVAVVDIAFGGTRVMQWTDHEKLLDRPRWHTHWTNQVEQLARQREASRWIDANKCRDGKTPKADAAWEPNVRLPEKVARGVTWYRKRFAVPEDLIRVKNPMTMFSVDGFKTKHAVVSWFVGDTGWVAEQRCLDGELKDLNAGHRWRDEARQAIRDGKLEIVLRYEAKLPGGEVVYDTPRFGKHGEKGFAFGLDGWERCVTAVYPPLAEAGVLPKPYAVPQDLMERFYNSMAWPFHALTFRGFLWYQGCSDACGDDVTGSYRRDLTTMVADWRELFANPAAPFYCVQLTGYGGLQRQPGEQNLQTEVREAQRLFPRGCANSWTAICHDLGESECHGREKIPVGVRLAEIALARDYGVKGLCWRSADYREMTVTDGAATLRFETWGSPLVAHAVRTDHGVNQTSPRCPVTRHSPDSQLEGFTVCDEKGVWHWADAEITGPDTVRVTAKGVTAIRRVRYDWGGLSIGNLWNEGGLPVSCFDTANDLPVPRDLRYFNVVPINNGDVEFAAREVKRQRALGVKAIAVCLSYHPQCTPAKNLLPIHAANFRKLKALLADTDVETGVLVQSTAGHGWNGRMQLSKETWQRAINVDGNVQSRWCQLDPGFRAYVLEAIRSIAKEGPSFLLIDDDFGPKVGEGFCPLHVALYNRATGETRTCEEWRKLAKEGASRDPLRRKMEEARRQVPIAFSKEIRAVIDSVDPKIRCGMCTPGGGIDFTKDVAQALAGPNTKPFIRICNQVYGIVHPVDFIGQHQRVRQLADLFGGVEELVAEADTWPQNHWSTPARYFGTQLIYDVLFGLDGAKIWMSEFERNEDTGSQARFEKIFRDELPKRQALYDILQTKHPRFHGVTDILNHGDGSDDLTRARAIGSGSLVRSVFQPFGFPCEFAKAGSKDPRDVYALSRNSVRMMTDAEIRLVLAHRAYVDASGAKELTARGFAELLGVEATGGDTGFFFNRELPKDGAKPLMINWDATAAYLKPLSDKVEVLSEFVYRDPMMAAPEVKAPGLVYFRNRLGGEVAVAGWTFETCGGYMPWNKYLRVGRKEQLVKAIDRLAGGSMPFVAAENNHAMVSWASLEGGETLLVATNLAVDDWQDLRLRLDRPPAAAKLLADDGTWKPVVAEKTGEKEVTFRVGKVSCLVPQILLLSWM